MASALDYFKKTGNSTATVLSTPGHTIGGTSITVGSTANWPTTTGVTFAIDVVTLVGTEEVQTAGTYTLWHGTVSGTTISNMTLATESPNSDQNYAAGSLTRVYLPVSAALHNKAMDGILVHADQDGTLKAGAVDNAAVVASGILTADRSTAGANIETWRSEDVFDHIASGCVWSGDAYGSTRVASCTSGVVYIAGKRLTVAAVTSRTFTASKDVYCDLKDNGDGTAVWVYYDNTTNAASPSFATTGGTVRGAIIVVGASNIANAAAINQGQEDRVLPIASSVPYSVTDSPGNLICPRDPNRRLLGYRQTQTSQSGVSISSTIVTGLAATVNIPTARKVEVTVCIPSVSNSAAAAAYLELWNSATPTGTLLQLTQIYMPTLGTGNTISLTYTGTLSGTQSFCAALRTNTGSLSTTMGSTQTGLMSIKLV